MKTFYILKFIDYERINKTISNCYNFIAHKRFLIPICFSLFVGNSFAQCPGATILQNNGNPATNERAPMSRYKLGRGVYLVTAAEISASGIVSGQSITGIGWTNTILPGVIATGNLIIYLENTTDATNLKSTTWANAIVGMTEVHNASTTLTNTFQYDVSFAGGSAFVYNGGSLYIGYDWGCYSGTLSTTQTLAATNVLVGGANGDLASQNALNCTVSGTTTASAFRPETRLFSSSLIANDISVEMIYSLGKLPTLSSHAVRALVKNNSSSTINSINVTLNVSGANSFSDVQTIPSLGTCASTVVTFASYTPSNTGSNSISISVANDANNSNNTKNLTQTVNGNNIAYKDASQSNTAGTGISSSTGQLALKFSSVAGGPIAAISVEFNSGGIPYRLAAFAEDGFGNPGAQIYSKRSNRTSITGSVQTLIPSSPLIVPAGNFFIAIQQMTTSFINLAYTLEYPLRQGNFYSAALPAVTWTDLSSIGSATRLNLEVIFATPLAGTKNIPGDYVTVSAAVADLNFNGVGSGGVIFEVASGYTENITSPIAINATGTSSNPIEFRGNGTHPLITRTDAGTNVTTQQFSLGDPIIQLNGIDYITFDAIDLAAINQGIEYGYYTNKPNGTNGCKFITIKNCVITMTKGTSRFVTGIYISNGPTSLSSPNGVAVTSNEGRNENITIISNTISNVHNGICGHGYFNNPIYFDLNYVIGASGNGNIIQKFGGGSQSNSYGIYLIYANNATVDYNNINNAAAGGVPHNYQLFGINLYDDIGNLQARHNTIELSHTYNGLDAYWIFQGYDANATTFSSLLTVNDNIFSGSCMNGNLIYLFTHGDVTISGNSNAGTLIANAGIDCIQAYNSGPGNTVISNNQFLNFNVTEGMSGIIGSGSDDRNTILTDNIVSNIVAKGFTGIRISGPGNCSNNIIQNISVLTASSQGVIGIEGVCFGGSATQNIFDNEINSLSTTSSTFYGISTASVSGHNGTINVFRNKISELTGAGTFAQFIYGIITSAKNSHIYNNLIGNLLPKPAGNILFYELCGIVINPAQQSNVKVEYNTISLSASGYPNLSSIGIYFQATPSTVLTLKNNIINNNCLAAGGGIVAAISAINSNQSNFDPASDNNLLYAGIPSASQVIFYENNSVAYQTLADYKTYMYAIGAEQHSVTENVNFQSTVGTNPNFLKFNTSIPSQVESGAINIPGIVDDYSGTVRQGNPFYSGTGTAPDIGAWELEGIAYNSSGVTLQLKVYIQGFYSGNGLMDNDGMGGCLYVIGEPGAGQDFVDTVEVGIMNGSPPYEEIESKKGILKTSGDLNVTFTAAVIAGQSYFLRVLHRNSITTWSRLPVLISTITNYDFTDASSKAYDDGFNLPMKLVDTSPDRWAIYNGDINRDGAVDSGDMTLEENASNAGDYGYYTTDLTGDGGSDSLDMTIIEDNGNAGVFEAHP